MEFQDALSYINLGNCVLFVGSGFSVGATNKEGIRLPVGEELSSRLYQACNESSEGGTLTDASELYIEMFGEESLVRFLKKTFSVSSLTQEQILVTSLPWKRVYTTNYDNVVELGYSMSDRVITPKVISDEIVSQITKTKICVHLNGYIENLDLYTIQKDFKLTDVSYSSSDFSDSSWLALFDSDLRSADAIFFLGFSMKSDLDIKRVVYSDPQTLTKCFFIVWEGENKPTIRTLENYGTVLPINVSGFVEEYKKVHPRVKKIPISYRCFKEINGEISVDEIIDKDVHDLLTLGVLDSEKIAASMAFPDKRYYMKRSVMDTIISHVQAGDKRILIHSDLGNGKTLLLQGLAILLANKKYNVFWFLGDYYNVEYEIEQICTNNQSMTVIIVDNYSHYRSVLELLRVFAPDCILILSERSVVNETTTEWLFPKLGEFIEFDINRLNNEDITSLMQILEEFGFWSSKASWGEYDKREYLTRSCKGRLRNVLIDLLKSPEVFGRFNKIINEIQHKQGYYEALLLMLIGKVFNLNLDLENVSLILGREYINNSGFRKNHTISEFVNFNQGNIIVRSSLLAEVILSKLSDTTTIVNLLIKVFIKLDNFRMNNQYQQILKTLLLYSNLHKILNKTDGKCNENLYRFFEKVKTLNFCKSNPHFWLQYAILVLSSRDYGRAEKYFETAYSYANKKREFETFAIDNHYARYILENELESGSHETCMEAFLKAHKILTDPIHKTKVRFYPYRVAQNYYPFYEKFYKVMTTKDKKKFLSCCDEIYDRAKSYAAIADSQLSKRDVIKAIKLLEQIRRETSR